MKVKGLAAIALSAICVLSLTSCTPASNPAVDAILSTDLSPLELINEVKGHCYPMELFCSNPLFEPVFSAPASATPEVVCDVVIDLQQRIGLVAYAVEGYSAANVSSVGDLKAFCTEGLSNPWPVGDGTIYYEGTVLYDDGSQDGIGKVTVIQRREDDRYVVVFSSGRDLHGPGNIPYGEDPKHRTK